MTDFDPAPQVGQVEATQVAHSGRATARTIFQAIVALAAMFPLVYQAVQAAYADNAHAVPDWLAGAFGVGLVVAGVITRIMALPAVNQFLETYVPILGARPKSDYELGA